jgi:hypothetical protein
MLAGLAVERLAADELMQRQGGVAVLVQAGGGA